MIDAVENIDNADPIHAVRDLEPVEPVYFREKTAGYSNIYESPEINNLFALAIEMSMAQIGIFNTSDSSSGDVFSSEHNQQALIKPFLGSLLESLQSQSVLAYESWIDSSLNEAMQPLRSLYPPPWIDTSINTANSGVFGTVGYHGHDYSYYETNDGLDMDLLRLIQKVSFVDSGALNNKSNDPSVFSLLLSFQDLIRFSGRSDRNLGNLKVLGTFLKTLSANIQGVNSSGNFINGLY